MSANRIIQNVHQNAVTIQYRRNTQVNRAYINYVATESRILMKKNKTKNLVFNQKLIRLHKTKDELFLYYKYKY